ncbi:upstream activation factor subunit uaf30 [Phtheirospermum japonicum]|uniref:Upstream activation factor subunit uaf30 n=1 Tax=Phtheirospermum japonicum TaxID=374723 RepID=A0A830CDP1_9LAMI|nr:upstream activation factor subunit uaf30 [Phtheirospermum japonicum]
MVSDQEIAQGVETVLRQSDPNAVTSLNCVVQQLEAKLGLDLTHKADFIRDQITFLLRSHPVPKDQLPPQPQPQPQLQYPNILVHQPFHQPHFALHQPQQQHPPRLHHQTSPACPPPPQLQRPHPPPVKEDNAAANVSESPKGRAPAGSKRRGGPGGLNKVCGVSPKLQAIVGEPALPRTEIVKQLWAYIRKHNLQDPGNKRKIICDDALRLVFETDSTDMFKMNKLLAKHILPLDPTRQSDQAKKVKVEDDSGKQNPDSNFVPVVISDALAKFFGTGEREMLQSEALGRVWEYIKVNQLEDPLSSMVIHCDAKLQELLGCESISALGIQEMLVRHHLLKQ